MKARKCTFLQDDQMQRRFEVGGIPSCMNFLKTNETVIQSMPIGRNVIGNYLNNDDRTRLSSIFHGVGNLAHTKLNQYIYNNDYTSMS